MRNKENMLNCKSYTMGMKRSKNETQEEAVTNIKLLDLMRYLVFLKDLNVKKVLSAEADMCCK